MERKAILMILYIFLKLLQDKSKLEGREKVKINFWSERRNIGGSILGNQWTFSDCVGHSWEQLPSMSLFSSRAVSQVPTHFNILNSTWGGQATWRIVSELLEAHSDNLTWSFKELVCKPGLLTWILVRFPLQHPPALAMAEIFMIILKDKTKSEDGHLELTMNCMVYTFCVYATISQEPGRHYFIAFSI